MLQLCVSLSRLGVSLSLIDVSLLQLHEYSAYRTYLIVCETLGLAMLNTSSSSRCIRLRFLSMDSTIPSVS